MGMRYNFVYDGTGYDNSHMYGGLEFENVIITGDDFTYGNCGCAYIKFKTDVNMTIGHTILLLCQMHDYSQSALSYTFGRFDVSSIVKEKVTQGSQLYTVEAYDHMTKFNVNVDEWLMNTVFAGSVQSVTLNYLFQQLCTKIGIQIDSYNYNQLTTNQNYTVKKFTAQNITGRQLLGWIGSISANNFVISPNDTLYILPINSGNPTSTDDKCIKSINSYDYQSPYYNRIWCGSDQTDTGLFYPSTAPATPVQYTVTYNPLIDTSSSDTTWMQNILSQLQSNRYQPMDITLFEMAWPFYGGVRFYNETSHFDMFCPWSISVDNSGIILRNGCNETPDSSTSELESATWSNGYKTHVVQNNLDTFSSVITATVQGVRDDLGVVSNTVSGHTTSISELNQSVHGITISVSELEETVEGHTSDIASITTTVGEIKSEVSSVKSTVNSHTNTLEAHATSISTIDQKADSIELEVSDGNYLASKINLTQNTISINSAHISLTGNDINNRINDASTTVDISADKINLTGYLTITAGDSRYDASGAAATAESNAISTAASDATTKANAAQSNAISTAAGDATTKANNARTNAVSDITSGLSAGSTTINGGCIQTGNIVSQNYTKSGSYSSSAPYSDAGTLLALNDGAFRMPNLASDGSGNLYANITGGSININTDSASSDKIQLNYSTSIGSSTLTTKAVLAPGYLRCTNILDSSYNNMAQYNSSGVNIYDKTSSTITPTVELEDTGLVIREVSGTTQKEGTVTKSEVALYDWVGSQGIPRTRLTRDGLYFRNSSSVDTAYYPASMPSLITTGLTTPEFDQYYGPRCSIETGGYMVINHVCYVNMMVWINSISVAFTSAGQWRILCGLPAPLLNIGGTNRPVYGLYACPDSANDTKPIMGAGLFYHDTTGWSVTMNTYASLTGGFYLMISGSYLTSVLNT